MKTLTAERLRELLHYDPETGVFKWIQRASIRVRMGGVAGCNTRRTGYRRISVDGKQYQAHRLAHLYMTGEWPPSEIDHANGVRSDNRWANLRACTPSENRQNMAVRADNRSGYTGVCWVAKERRWVAQIRVSGKNFQVGRFDTAEDAYAAYCAAKRRLHAFAPVVALRPSVYPS